LLAAERRPRRAYVSPADDQALCFIAVALTVRRKLLWRREILPNHKYHTNRLASCGSLESNAALRLGSYACPIRDGYAPALSPFGAGSSVNTSMATSRLVSMPLMNATVRRPSASSTIARN